MVPVMSMRSLRSFFAPLALAGALVSCQPSSLPTSANSPLPTGPATVGDPHVVTAKLGNGASYTLLPGSGKDVALMLQVRAGSEEEAEDQKGAAHLVEHLVFDGSRSLKVGDVSVFSALRLVPFAHRYSDPEEDQTLYRLDLPDAKPQTLRLGLALLAKWVGPTTFTQGQLEAIRNTLSTELYRYETPDVAIEQAIAEASYDGTSAASHPAMGARDTISQVSLASAQAYHDAWYEPANLSLYIAGPVDSSTVAAAVKDTIGELAPSNAAPPLAPKWNFAPSAETTYVTKLDPGAEDAGILVQRVSGASTLRDTVWREKDALCRQVAEEVFSRRIQLSASGDPSLPVANAALFVYNRFGFSHVGVSATARRPQDALAALALAVTEFRRMVAYGPTPPELDLARKSIEADLDAAVTEPQSNVDRCDDARKAMEDGWVVQSPAQRRSLLKPLLEGLTPADVVATLAGDYGRIGRDVVAVTGTSDLGTGGEDAVKQAYTKAMTDPVAPPEAAAVSAWAYGDLPQPNGTQWMTERPEEAAQGLIVRWSHKNGFRVQVRPNHATAGQVLVALRFDIADANLRTNRPRGATELIERGLVPGGLGRHSAAEVASLFADSTVRFEGIHISEDAITYRASCQPKDLVRAIQLLRAYFGDPGFRKEAEAPVKQEWLDELAAQNRDLSAQVDRKVQAAIAGPTGWERPVTADEIKAITFDKASDWLSRALTNDTLTVTIVGDVQPDAADTATLWLGAYAVDSHFMMASTMDVRNSSPAQPPLKPGLVQVTAPGGGSHAIVEVVWPTDDAYDIQQTRGLEVLAGCLGANLVNAAAQELGPEATAKVWSIASESYRGGGQLIARLTVPADKASAARALIMGQAAALGSKGPESGVVADVVAQKLKELGELKASNEYWISVVLPYASWQPFRMSWVSSAESDYRASTPATMKSLASQYLKPSRALIVVGTPGK